MLVYCTAFYAFFLGNMLDVAHEHHVARGFGGYHTSVLIAGEDQMGMVPVTWADGCPACIKMPCQWQDP